MDSFQVGVSSGGLVFAGGNARGNRMNFQMFPRFENGFLFDGLSRAATSSGLAGWLDAAAAVVGYFAIFLLWIGWLRFTITIIIIRIIKERSLIILSDEE